MSKREAIIVKENFERFQQYCEDVEVEIIDVFRGSELRALETSLVLSMRYVVYAELTSIS